MTFMHLLNQFIDHAPRPSFFFSHFSVTKSLRILSIFALCFNISRPKGVKTEGRVHQTISISRLQQKVVIEALGLNAQVTSCSFSRQFSFSFAQISGPDMAVPGQIVFFFCGKYQWKLPSVMNFKLPCFTQKAISPRITRLLSFNCNDLTEVCYVGQGSLLCFEWPPQTATALNTA